MITDKAEINELLSELLYTCTAVVVDHDAVTYPVATYPDEGGELESIDLSWVDASYDCHEERIDMANVYAIEMLPGGKEIKILEKGTKHTCLCFLTPMPPREATAAEVVARAEQLFGDELWGTTGETTAQALFDVKREMESIPR